MRERKDEQFRTVKIEVPEALLDRLCALDARFWGAWQRDITEVVESALRSEAERLLRLTEEVETRDLREQLFLVDQGL